MPDEDEEPEVDVGAVVEYVVVATEPETVTVAVTVTMEVAAPVVEEVSVAFPPVAVDLNWSNLSPGLTAKTMPC